MAAWDVEFADVSFTTPGGHSILRDVTFTVRAGETVALLGRSGSGKTTLLRTVNALVRPTNGRVLVGGEDVAQAEVIGLRRAIGYVVQEGGLFPHWTIERNIGASLELGGRPKGEIRERARELLRKVGLPEEVARRKPAELSGGQRQRVGVARALAAEPRVLLMDEPFGALDPLTRAEMQSMLRELLCNAEMTTLIVTHDLGEALYLADRVVLVEAGEVRADIPAAEVMRSENEAVRKYVAAAHVSESRRAAPDSLAGQDTGVRP